jgi:phenylpyruvate tautomerase PptA (4-oxalocrotonate tautomerase family)
VAKLPLPACRRKDDRVGITFRNKGHDTMPMIDAIIPEGALTPDAEASLIKKMTDILIAAEGFDPQTNTAAQSVSVVFVHRPAAVYVAGAPAREARYRITPSVPEGKYSDEAVEALVRKLTEAFVDAEGGTFDDVASRVWIFPTEIPEGRWGGRGVLRSVVDIQAMLGGEHQRELGKELLARRRRAKALEFVEAVADAARRGA